MKASFVLLFVFLAMNGAWATFPLPYIQLGVLPPPQEFIHRPLQRFGAQPQFLVYPQYTRDFLNVYQPLSYVQPQRYNYYNQFEYPQAARYSAYPEYFPVPENSHNPVTQYIYQQTVQHPVPNALEGSTKNLEPTLLVVNKMAEEPETEKMSKQSEETAADSKSEEITANPTNSADVSKPEEVTTNPVNAADDSKSDEVTTNPKNSANDTKSDEVTTNPKNSADDAKSQESKTSQQNAASKPEPTKPTKPVVYEEAEDIAAKSTDDDSETTLSTEEISTKSTTA